MHESSPESLRTDQRLTLEEQQAVLILATRLQQEYDEGATLADLILMGQEAGLSREAVEEAFRRVTTQPSESTQRIRMGRAFSRELVAVLLTNIWALVTWAGVLLLPISETLGMVGVASTFFIFPLMVGLLVRRPWVAGALAACVSLNLMIAFTVRLGFPQSAGAREDLLIFFLPILLALVVSGIHRLWTNRAQPGTATEPRSLPL